MPNAPQIQIAIDGPAAAGKSTVAALTAEQLGGCYINTGNMYRALTWAALQRNIDPENEAGKVAAMLAELDLKFSLNQDRLPILALNDEELPLRVIRHPEVADKVSFIARIPEVREWLVNRQRETAQFGLIVMEGRDVGTVIFPDTKHKFYITAEPEVRARRRLAQAGEVPDQSTIESVAAEIARRDELDQTRPVAPLRPAPDAEIIHTDNLNAEQVAELIARRVQETEKNL